MSTPRIQSDTDVWASIYAARYDFAAVGAAIFSLFGFVAAVVASTHVIFSLFGSAYDAIAYGVALFLLAEGVAYYVEAYALFAGRLRWWLWVLRWVGPLLSASAGGLAVYGWLPTPYKWLAVVTTVVVPLFQWGFLSILTDRIRLIHDLRLRAAAPAPTVEERLIVAYQELTRKRALDDLERFGEMIAGDRTPRMLPEPTQEQPDWLRELQNEGEKDPYDLSDILSPPSTVYARVEQPTYPTPVAVTSTTKATHVDSVATSKPTRSCPTCGVAYTPQTYAIAKRYDPEQARCTDCRRAAS